MTSESLLVGTAKRLILVEDDHQTVVQEGTGPYRGITWSERFIYVASNVSVQVLDHSLELQEILPLSVGAELGQIHYYKGRLYVTDPDYQRVAVWNTLDRQCEYIKWWGKKGIESNGWGNEYLNSVWEHSGLLFTVEHRDGKTPMYIRIWDEMRTAEGVKWNLHSTVPILRKIGAWNQRGIHNVYMEELALYTLASNQIVVVQIPEYHASFIDPDGIEEDHRMHGLARTFTRWYVGVSDTGPTVDGHVFVYDHFHQLKKVVVLPKSGRVLEVRALLKDKAHNRLPCPYTYGNALSGGDGNAPT